MPTTYRELHFQSKEPIGFALRRVAIRAGGARAVEYRHPMKPTGIWGPLDKTRIQKLQVEPDNPLMAEDQFELYPDSTARLSACLFVLDETGEPIRYVRAVEGGSSPTIATA